MGAPITYGRVAETKPVRLMVVDDSIVARSVFQTMIAPHADLKIVSTASTADQALARLAVTPVDIVLLDLAMPGMDGLTALPEIVRRGAGARVLVVSASATEGAESCVRALTLGAADTLEKPRAGSFNAAFANDLVEKIRRIAADSHFADRDVTEHHENDEPVVQERVNCALQPAVDGPVECIAIGASTGGLHALSAFFRALPKACDAPILITQHLPASFMRFFARQIADIADRPAEVAREGVALRAGRILVAPGDAHIRLARMGKHMIVRLDREPAASGCLPSVDPMFEAVAEQYGAAAFAVVLSGMGRDGMIGARVLVEAGGEVVAQDRATSVVWGMPGSVSRAGLAALIAPPADLAGRLAERVGGRALRLASWK